MRSDTKKSILFVAFGSTVTTVQATYDGITRLAKHRFRDWEINWAFTSRIARDKLKAEGLRAETVEKALQRMEEEGVEQIAVQSLYIIAGIEHERMCRKVRTAVSHGRLSADVVIGMPLLSRTEDVQHVAGLLLAEADRWRDDDDALVIMAHGSTEHPSHLAYLALAAELRRLDPYCYLGTLDQAPFVEDVLDACKLDNIKSAVLLPFVVVAGRHVAEDMAGSSPDSWASQFQDAGIRIVPVLHGSAEYSSFAEVWLDHLSKAMESFKE
jgi:sirohydrochlorin cobaltochelatase